MTRRSQCSQVGARAWISHSKLSNVYALPSMTTAKALSYSFPQVSLRRSSILTVHRHLTQPSAGTEPNSGKTGHSSAGVWWVAAVATQEEQARCLIVPI